MSVVEALCDRGPMGLKSLMCPAQTVQVLAYEIIKQVLTAKTRNILMREFS